MVSLSSAHNSFISQQIPVVLHFFSFFLLSNALQRDFHSVLLQIPQVAMHFMVATAPFSMSVFRYLNPDIYPVHVLFGASFCDVRFILPHSAVP